MKLSKSHNTRILIFPNTGFGDVIQACGVFELSKHIRPDMQVHCAVYAREHADLLQHHAHLDGILPAMFKQEARGRLHYLIPLLIKYNKTIRLFKHAYLTINPDCLGWTTTLPLKIRKIRMTVCDDSRPDRPDYPIFELYQRMYGKMLGVTEPPVFQPKLYLLPEERQVGCQMIESLGLDPGKLAVVAYDAGMPLKQIPVKTAVTICRVLADRGHQILLIKGTSNSDAARQIIDTAGIPIKAFEVRGSIRQLMKVIAHSRIVAAPDTGIAHMAAALNVPVISFFGPTHPAFRPAGDRNFLIQKSLSCPARHKAWACWANCAHKDYPGGDQPGPCMSWFNPLEIEMTLDHFRGKN